MSLTSRSRPRAGRGTRSTPVVFDLALATEAVRLVRRIVSDIANLKNRHLQVRTQIDRLSSGGRTRERFLLEDEAREIRGSLRSVIDELHGVGVVLLHPIRGEVGFPTLVNGSLAYLVYRSEDDGIRHWRYRDQPRLRKIPGHWESVESVSEELEEEGLLT